MTDSPETPAEKGDQVYAVFEKLVSGLSGEESQAVADRFARALGLVARQEIRTLLAGYPTRDEVQRLLGAAMDAVSQSLTARIAEIVRNELTPEAMPVLLLPEDAGDGKDGLESLIHEEVGRIALPGTSPEALYEGVVQRLQPHVARVIREALQEASGAADRGLPDLDLPVETLRGLAQRFEGHRRIGLRRLRRR